MLLVLVLLQHEERVFLSGEATDSPLSALPQAESAESTPVICCSLATVDRLVAYLDSM